jgi:hypothetical protein
VWQRATTKQHDLTKAPIAARELVIEAEIRKRSNLPVATRKLCHMARLAIERREHEERIGRLKVMSGAFYIVATSAQRYDRL